MTNGLHMVARIALRFMGPRDAFALVSRLSRALPRLEPSVASSRSLGGGTCLSRAITLAARIPGARVAVGVKKGGYRAIHATRFGLRPKDVIAAHAWIEVAGRSLDHQDEYGKVVAYLEPTASPRP